MVLSAIQKYTLIDFPGKIACIAFTPGCNFRCGYCHNAEFVVPEKIKKIKSSFVSEDTFFNFLETRKGMLEGVVISGGEPTLMHGLLAFVIKIKQMGFSVKIDTNGNRPEVIKKLIDELVIDYVALDVKTSFDRYEELCKGLADGNRVKETFYLLQSSGVEHEVRTTLIKEVHTEKVLAEMSKDIRRAHIWFLQRFRSQKTLDPKFISFQPFSSEEMKLLARKFTTSIRTVQVRD